MAVQPWQETRTHCFGQKNNSGAARHFHWSLLESFPSKGIVEGADESSRGLWNVSPGFWSYFFLWADFLEFDFAFKRGNTEPAFTHTLTHLPEGSQIRKQLSCLRGPGLAWGWGRWGSGGGRREREGKRRRLKLQATRRAYKLLIPQSTAKWLNSPISYLPWKECGYVEKEKIWKLTELHFGHHETFIWDSEGWSHLVC